MNEAVIVARLEERLLPIPKNSGSNPVVGKFYLLSTALKMSGFEPWSSVDRSDHSANCATVTVFIV